MLNTTLKNPFRSQIPEDEVYLEDEIRGMLSRFLDSVLISGKKEAVDNYVNYFHKFFLSEYHDKKAH